MPNSTNTNPLPWKHGHSRFNIDWGRWASFWSLQEIKIKKTPWGEIIWEWSKYMDHPQTTFFDMQMPLHEFINMNSLVLVHFEDWILDDKFSPRSIDNVTIYVDKYWKTINTPILCLGRAQNSINNNPVWAELHPITPYMGGLVTSPLSHTSTWDITPTAISLCVDFDVPLNERLENTLYFITET